MSSSPEGWSPASSSSWRASSTPVTRAALWETPWFVAVPLVTGGLCLAGAVAFLTGPPTPATARRGRTATG